MKVKRFEDLETWQKASELSQRIIVFTSTELMNVEAGASVPLVPATFSGPNFKPETPNLIL